ncbi:MAG: HEPN domain-containing protein [Chitinophagaceae bacterium]|nr:HEPN domain-containing protein [Chitinophagaceae bacterium]
MPITKPSTIGILPRSLQQVLAEVVNKIVSAVQPEKIICYGLRSVHYQDWGCFLDEGVIRDTYRLKLDLLIIAPVTKGQLEQDISFAAEQQCKPLADVHCITHKIHSVNENLTKGNPFFCALYNKGLLIYDAGQTALDTPGLSVGTSLERNILEVIWSRWYGLAQHFYKSAVDSQDFERPDLTAFMLHQAMEHTCGALIRIFTGYRPNTHNLSRLLMMVENFTDQFTRIFPKGTKQEEDLYSVLQHGYLDARYKDEYIVPIGILDILIQRVQEAQAVAAILYQEKLSLYSLPKVG